MNRRYFVGALSAAFTVGQNAAAHPFTSLQIDGTTFRAWHRKDRMFAEFIAPTQGWIAVGFNNEDRLQGTRFVIGAWGNGVFRAEEHIALVPHHSRVQDLGLASAVKDVVGSEVQNGTKMKFSLPHHFGDSENPRLAPDTDTNLMLAWSQQKDFDHHSFWRRHLTIRL